jgi:hypothetical protein
MLRGEAAGQVRQTLERVKQLVGLTGGQGISEADTRVHFIDPLLLALGYTALGEVQREVYVKDTRDFIDYALTINGQQRIAVEAKRLSHNLTEGDAGQLIQYCAILGIEWAVLTNGREWRLYHQFAQVALADKLLFKLDLLAWQTEAEFDAFFDQFWLVSKEAFEVSDGPRAWLRAQRLDQGLRDALTNPASAEVKYLRKRLADQDLAASAEDVAAWFKGRLLEPPPIPGPPVAPTAPSGTGPRHRRDRQQGPSYWLVPASGHQGLTSVQSLQAWLSQDMWGFWESTAGRKAIRPGDWIAFYAVKSGVVAYARVSGLPDTLVSSAEWPEPVPQEVPVYKVPLADVTWLPKAISITVSKRAELDAFKGRNVKGNWAWLVQTARRLSDMDFLRLTGRA